MSAPRRGSAQALGHTHRLRRRTLSLGSPFLLLRLWKSRLRSVDAGGLNAFLWRGIQLHHHCRTSVHGTAVRLFPQRSRTRRHDADEQWSRCHFRHHLCRCGHQPVVSVADGLCPVVTRASASVHGPMDISVDDICNLHRHHSHPLADNLPKQSPPARNSEILISFSCNFSFYFAAQSSY